MKTNISIRHLKRMAKEKNWPQKKYIGDRQTYIQPITLELESMTKCDKNKIAFPYYGGKFSHLSWILPLLPKDIQEYHYVEPFGGSMAVLINKPKSKVETCNDANKEIINFFRVLRNKDKREQLLESIYFTPYSRVEYQESFECENDNDIEKARKFYVKIRMSMHSLGRDQGQFRISIKQNSPLTKRLRNSIGDLWEVSNRILDVHIENMDALDLIKKYDAPNTFFYVDPPYRQDNRVDKNSYQYEFFAHDLLEKVLNKIKGKFLLSGYGQYDLNLVHEKLVPCSSSRHTGKNVKRLERCWANYLPAKNLVK